MSLFFKVLRISGIRSYSPDTVQTIYFSRPLTVILGKNGSGKTTIIEALRYVLTDSLPPGTLKGAKFVYDSPTRKESVTNAMIELEMEVNGKTITILRKMQVKRGQKGGAPAFVRLPSVVTVGGREVVLKPKEYMQEIVKILPIPVSLLDNVVLCHHEDSDWMYGTDKDVKERFDKILAVDKYQDGIDYLTKEAKTLGAKRKELDLRIEAARTKYDIAKRYEEQKSRLKRNMKSNKTTLDKLNSELESIARILGRLGEVKREYDGYGVKASQLGERLKLLQANESKCSRMIAEIEGETGGEADNTDASEKERLTLQAELDVLATQKAKLEERRSRCDRDIAGARLEFNNDIALLDSMVNKMLAKAQHIGLHIEPSKYELERLDKGAFGIVHSDLIDLLTASMKMNEDERQRHQEEINVLQSKKATTKVKINSKQVESESTQQKKEERTILRGECDRLASQLREHVSALGRVLESETSGNLLAKTEMECTSALDEAEEALRAVQTWSKIAKQRVSCLDTLKDPIMLLESTRGRLHKAEEEHHLTSTELSKLRVEPLGASGVRLDELVSSAKDINQRVSVLRESIDIPYLSVPQEMLDGTSLTLDMFVAMEERCGFVESFQGDVSKLTLALGNAHYATSRDHEELVKKFNEATKRRRSFAMAKQAARSVTQASAARASQSSTHIKLEDQELTRPEDIALFLDSLEKSITTSDVPSLKTMLESAGQPYKEEEEELERSGGVDVERSYKLFRAVLKTTGTCPVCQTPKPLTNTPDAVCPDSHAACETFDKLLAESKMRHSLLDFRKAAIQEMLASFEVKEYEAGSTRVKGIIGMISELQGKLKHTFVDQRYRVDSMKGFQTLTGVLLMAINKYNKLSASLGESESRIQELKRQFEEQTKVVREQIGSYTTCESSSSTFFDPQPTKLDIDIRVSGERHKSSLSFVIPGVLKDPTTGEGPWVSSKDLPSLLMSLKSQSERLASVRKSLKDFIDSVGSLRDKTISQLAELRGSNSEDIPSMQKKIEELKTTLNTTQVKVGELDRQISDQEQERAIALQKLKEKKRSISGDIVAIQGKVTLLTTTKGQKAEFMGSLEQRFRDIYAALGRLDTIRLSITKFDNNLKLLEEDLNENDTKTLRATKRLKCLESASNVSKIKQDRNEILADISVTKTELETLRAKMKETQEKKVLDQELTDTSTDLSIDSPPSPGGSYTINDIPTLQEKHNSIRDAALQSQASISHIRSDLQRLGNEEQTDGTPIADKLRALETHRELLLGFASGLTSLVKHANSAIKGVHDSSIRRVNSKLGELWTGVMQAVEGPKSRRGSSKGMISGTLQIRREEEKPEAKQKVLGISGFTRRQYSYSLVIYRELSTGNSESFLPMRVCSSGQRAIGSALLRIALLLGIVSGDDGQSSECNTLLALDEPTSNVDRTNSESFARALSELLVGATGERCRSSFQLILITHDRMFLEYLCPTTLGIGVNCNADWDAEDAMRVVSVKRSPDSYVEYEDPNTYEQE